MIQGVLRGEMAGPFADDQGQFWFKMKDTGVRGRQGDGPTMTDDRVGGFEEGIEEAPLRLLRFQIVAGQADELARSGERRTAAHILQGDARPSSNRILDARLEVYPIVDEHFHHFLGRMVAQVRDRSRGIQYLFTIPDAQFVVIEEKQAHRVVFLCGWL